MTRCLSRLLSFNTAVLPHSEGAHRRAAFVASRPRVFGHVRRAAAVATAECKLDKNTEAKRIVRETVAVAPTRDSDDVSRDRHTLSDHF
eukprot:6188726-Pleurochrysis_carterae.AAC.1